MRYVDPTTKKRLALDVSLYKRLQILSATLFENTPHFYSAFRAGAVANASPTCTSAAINWSLDL